MMMLRIQSVGVAVKNLKLVARFFLEKLNCKVYYHSDCLAPFAYIKFCDSNIILYQIVHSQDVNPRNQDVSMNPLGIDHIALQCKGIDNIYHDLVARGVTFNGKPESFPQWKFRMVSFVDPEENCYYLIEDLK